MISNITADAFGTLAVTLTLSGFPGVLWFENKARSWKPVILGEMERKLMKNTGEINSLNPEVMVVCVYIYTYYITSYLMLLYYIIS